MAGRRKEGRRSDPPFEGELLEKYLRSSSRDKLRMLNEQFAATPEAKSAARYDDVHWRWGRAGQPDLYGGVSWISVAYGVIAAILVSVPASYVLRGFQYTREYLLDRIIQILVGSPDKELSNSRLEALRNSAPRAERQNGLNLWNADWYNNHRIPVLSDYLDVVFLDVKLWALPVSVALLIFLPALAVLGPFATPPIKPEWVDPRKDGPTKPESAFRVQVRLAIPVTALGIYLGYGAIAIVIMYVVVLGTINLLTLAITFPSYVKYLAVVRAKEKVFVTHYYDEWSRAKTQSDADPPVDLARWDRERALEKRMAENGYTNPWLYTGMHGSGEPTGNSADDDAAGLWNRAGLAGDDRRAAAIELAGRTNISTEDAEQVLDQSKSMADLRDMHLGSAALEIAKIYRPDEN